MTPDPDHLHVLAVSLHVVECLPGAMPYDRYPAEHRERHERLARLLLARLNNAGWTLTNTEEN